MNLLKLKCTVPAQGTLSAVFRIFDPKALDAGLGRLPADRNSELDAAINALSLIALKGKVLTANASHCNARTVAAINAGGGDWGLAPTANYDAHPVGGAGQRRCSARWTPKRGFRR